VGRPGDVAAVLDSPPHLGLPPCPLQEPDQLGGAVTDRELVKFAAVGINRDRSVASLVRIHPNDDHVPVSFAEGDTGPAGGHT
jgi:hypothetical protein